MNFKKTTYSLVIGLIALCVSQPASADLILTFSSDNGTSFSNSFDVLTGDSLFVDVFLNEDDADNILDIDGLFGLGLTAVATPTTFGVISAAMIDPLYDFNTIDEFTDSTIDWEAAILLNDIPVAQSIFLGSFQFDTTASGTTVFSFADRLPGTGTANVNWLSGAGTELDQLIFGAGATGTFDLTINSTVIPEPGSSGLILLLLIASWQFGVRPCFRFST